MSQQAESIVPRPPPVTISLPQAQRIANLLQAARDEFVSLVTSFPPGHPQIRSILNRYPELTLQELERVLDQGRRLLVQIREDYTHRPNRQRAQAGVELHGRVQRQYTRLRDMLDFITEDLNEFNHLRVAPAPSSLQNSSAPSRSAGQPQSPAQPLPSRSGAASLFASPSPPRVPSQSIPSRTTRPPPQQLHPASPAPAQSSEFQPSERRRRSYQDLLEENRELREENMLLSQQLRRADRLIASWERREENEGEEEEEERRGGKRRRF